MQGKILLKAGEGGRLLHFLAAANFCSRRNRTPQTKREATQTTKQKDVILIIRVPLSYRDANSQIETGKSNADNSC